MDFDLTDAQRLTRDLVREFAEREVKPRAAEIDRADEFPGDLYKRMAELDILGMTVPSEYGGSGADTLSWCIAQEELARASAAVADAQLLSKLMSDMILANGTEAQRRRYLPAMVRGEKICAIAQTEPGAGSDVAGIQTTATPTADGYILNGTKRFITAALVCELAVVVATTDRRKGRAGITLLLVEMGTPGFARGSKESLLGVRGLATGELVFEDCRVPRSALLGGEGEGFKRAMISLDTGRIGIGAQALGIAQAAMEAAVAYARQRPAFGQPIAGFQAVQFMLADMSAQIEASRLLLRKAACLKDRGRPLIREAAEAKLVASETAARVTTDALQIHGAYGYSTEFPIERLYRDARVYQIWEGTSQIQRLVIARQLLK
ncbi:MAG TPA: acyl-CoA dehydrogenase family protein [Methylomirabilota bacterium]|jgi:alkylation response protein AidB-like acyl-CoA dehydrogenase|nr:acyl-CoA dehydrogenase family protein [Methylomirabilota bacterium]